MSLNINKIKNILLDGIYPRCCPVCNMILSKKDFMFCKECISELDFIKEPYCLKCGKPIMKKEDEFCPDCFKEERPYEYGFSLCKYDAVSSKIIFDLKYNNKRLYAESFAHLMMAKSFERIYSMQAECLIPVPVHKSRFRERGYNQAELTARYLSEISGISLCTDLLYRDKNTLAQKKLNPKERMKNLGSAFKCRENVRNIKSAVIVDDIYTTGSTVCACAKALKEAGLERVYYIALCIVP